jgi:hypothetical protein
VWLIVYTLNILEADLRSRREAMQLREPHFKMLRQPHTRRGGRSLACRLYEMLSLLWFQAAPNLKKQPNADEHIHPGTSNHTPKSANKEDKKRSKCLFNKWWVRFCYYGQPHWRLARAAVATVAMMMLWTIFARIFGEANVPARGLVAQRIYFWITITDVVITLLLIFLVVDATLYSRSVVRHLTALASSWPAKLVKAYKERWHLSSENLEDGLDMRFVADRTRCITRLIYFPFLMLALLIVSRSPIFNNYSYSACLVIGQLIILVIVIGSVVSLRHAAEQARNIAIQHLSERIIAAPNTASQLEMLITEVRDLWDGVFAPPFSQPIVKAVLLPLISYGGTWLAQLYALPGL